MLLESVMSEVADEMKARTMRFALDICSLIKHLPTDEPGQTVRRHLANSATSVAFNYRASCRARSHAEFTAKTGLVAEEADETQGWLEFIQAAKLTASLEVGRLLAEATELTKIVSASYGKARYNERNKRNNKSRGVDGPLNPLFDVQAVHGLGRCSEQSQSVSC